MVGDDQREHWIQPGCQSPGHRPSATPGGNPQPDDFSLALGQAQDRTDHVPWRLKMVERSSTSEEVLASTSAGGSASGLAKFLHGKLAMGMVHL